MKGDNLILASSILSGLVSKTKRPKPAMLDLFELCMVAALKQTAGIEYQIMWNGEKIRAIDVLQCCTYSIENENGKQA